MAPLHAIIAEMALPLRLDAFKYNATNLHIYNSILFRYFYMNVSYIYFYDNRKNMA